MQDYKLPIAKKTISILYEALKQYRATGVSMLSPDESVGLYKGWKKKLDSMKNDPQKQLVFLLSMPEDQIRAQEESFKNLEADLDILIARIQVLRKKLEGEQDSYIVENFLKELLK